MSDNAKAGMDSRQALRLEYFIIGIGILALVLIFQPFSLTVFSIGGMLVVLAGLLNNLLPLAQPGVPMRRVITVAMVVAMIFCIVLLVSIIVAYLYGAFFLTPPDPGTQTGRIQLAAKPWYLHSFTLSVAAVAAVLAGLITYRTRRAK
jgi:hypothetical protein